MNKAKILIMGANSYASTNLSAVFIRSGYEVTCFDRGETEKKDNFITGPVLELTKNEFLNQSFDVVINFILLKNDSKDNNIKYINELIKFCSCRGTSHLLHISSMSVYPNDSVNVNEQTPSEEKPENKGKYAALKVAIDNELRKNKNCKFHISFVRPGFIVTDDKPVSFAGIAKHMAFNLALLMGNKSTTLPVIERTILHQALLKIVELGNRKKVYLVFSNREKTKYQFVKNRSKYLIIPLPKQITIFLGKLLLLLGLFSKNQFKQVQGLFRNTSYSCIETQKLLNIDFK